MGQEIWRREGIPNIRWLSSHRLGVIESEAGRVHALLAGTNRTVVSQDTTNRTGNLIS
jgi:hypothetical protein